jgi:hypothetical protein
VIEKTEDIERDRDTVIRNTEREKRIGRATVHTPSGGGH